VTGHRLGLAEREVSLVEIVDRALGSGVVITGDLTISLADVDLIYLNLRLLVGSVGTILEGGSGARDDELVPVGSH
jgi:gas vesicle structural protein